MNVMENAECQDTALHDAVRFGDLEETRSALADGCNPNQIGSYQWTPLHEASSNGDADIVRLLLKYKADPNKQDELKGCTAVHYAASGGHTECLQLLLAAGGKHSVANHEGESCLEVATCDCRDLINEKEELIGSHDTLLDSDMDTHLVVLRDKAASSPSSIANSDYKESLSELDVISIETSDSFSSCGSGYKRNRGINDKVLGHAVLSFEYNSKKSSFKIRVWKICDLLLPPAETSLISGIYVKSYLFPDKHKKSKRKTEEVKPTYHQQSHKDSLSAVFQPSTFTFTNPLEYSGITMEQVSTKDIRLEVCVVQKYTRKSFAVATWQQSFLECTKKLLKEKYPLEPVMSAKIPENMKVYHSDLVPLCSSLHRLSASNPSLQRHSSSLSWAYPYAERSSSETLLSQIQVESPPERKIPSIEINVDEAEKEDTELEDALRQIAIMEERERPVSAMIEMKAKDTENDLSDIKVEQKQYAEVQIHISGEGNVTDEFSTRKYDKRGKTSFKKGKSKMKQSDIHVFDRSKELGSASRPDTPTWDGYEEPLSVTMVPIDFEENTADVPCLPMSFSMEMPEIHSSFLRVNNNNTKGMNNKDNIVSEV